MLALSVRTQLVVGITLAVLMAMTRGYHFTPLEHLPSASWAVFFLAGVYLPSRWVFPALLAEAAAIDFAAVTWGGVSNFCISPAYGFLLPAYGTLWLAGHWYVDRHRDAVTTLIPLTMSVLVGAAVCEVISSGSFYFLSGRFEQTDMTQFALRFAKYFPQSLSSMTFYVCIAGMIHVVARVSMTSFSRGRATT
ncbi:MAG TPA: hypothetical protein VN666_11855 [Nitrospira sp.]|nr:hypothetical protein [Nitrospira sp.]